ncbi:ATP-dependent Clp protease ATP-binding subunit [bacterium]|nr:ATP-dependent Clp protease ATP-binding subunit [bacterium]
MFDLNSAQIIQAVKLEKLIPLGVIWVLEIIFFFIFVISLINLKISVFNTHLSLGICYLSFSLWGILFLYRLFFEQKLKNPKVKNPENLAEFLDFQAAKAVDFAFSKKGDFSLLLLFYLLGVKELSFVYERLSLPRAEIRKEVKKKIRGTKKDVKEAEEILKSILKENLRKISIFDLLPSLAENEPFLRRLLDLLKIRKEELKEVCDWKRRIIEKETREKRFWERENLLRYGSVARDWAAGYTINLDNFSVDLTKIERKAFLARSPLYQEEIRRLENALIKPERNCALLVGESGVGKKEMIKNFARMVNQGKTVTPLNYKRILEIDMPLVLSTGREQGNVEGLLKLIFAEAVRAGNVILVIRQLHNFVGQRFGAKAVGKIDISPILLQYLSIPEFRLIATTTYEGLHQSIERAPEILGQFEKIEIKPPSVDKMLKIVEDEVLRIEKKAPIFFTYKAIKEIVELSDRYIQTSPFPKKAIDLLQEVTVYTLRQVKGGRVSPEIVEGLVSEKTEIPVGEAEEKEREVLLNLEKIIHQRVVDQEEAVFEVANALRRARAEIRKRERTIGNFLFLGPTGVGKTQVAKTLAEVYFGSEKRMIRLDMSEYQVQSSIERLIGTPTEPGYFTTKVREDPFSLILLDEIEKAHPRILDLFLQVLDEGYLTDGAGRRVDFRNTIIISTSNAGAELIREAIIEGKNLKQYKEEFINEILRRGIFRPEFLNRFDAVVLFRPLSQKHLLKIAEIMLSDLKKKLLEKNIEFLIKPELVEKISKLGFNPQFGAREMRRVIQEKVENNIAKAILSESIKSGDKIEIDPVTFKVKVDSDPYQSS